MKKMKKLLPIILITLLLFTACGEEKVPEFRLGDVYATVALDDLYDLKLEDEIGSLRPVSACINGDCILLGLSSDSEIYYADSYILFNVKDGTAAPVPALTELAASDDEYLITEAFISDDNAVIVVEGNGVISAAGTDGATLFNAEATGSYIGSDHADSVWHCGDGTLMRTDLDDGAQTEYTVPEDYRPFSFVFSDEKYSYVMANDMEYNFLVLRADAETGKAEPMTELGAFQSWLDGRLTYTADSFYFTMPSSYKDMIAIDKMQQEEYIWQMADEILISGMMEMEDNHDGTVTDRIYLTAYDLAGNVTEKLDGSMLNAEAFTPMDCDNEGRAVISVVIDGKNHILLWDAGSKAPKDAEYDTLDITDMAGSIASIAASCEAHHGVDVIYEKDEVEKYRTSYTLIPAAEGIELYGAIRTLDRSLDGYPKAMLSEIESYEGNPLQIYLGSDFVRESEYSIASAAAVADSTWDYLMIAFDISYADVMEQNLSHELTHILDGFVEDYVHKTNLDLMNYWTYGLNSEEYPYYYTYVDKYGIDVNVSTDLALRGDACKWFIDTYSRSFPTEDRARVFENLFMGNKELFESEELTKKARFLTAVLRAMFPDMAEEGEVLRWEEVCGVSDISEFTAEIGKYDD